MEYNKELIKKVTIGLFSFSVLLASILGVLYAAKVQGFSLANTIKMEILPCILLSISFMLFVLVKSNVLCKIATSISKLRDDDLRKVKRYRLAILREIESCENKITAQLCCITRELKIKKNIFDRLQKVDFGIPCLMDLLKTFQDLHINYTTSMQLCYEYVLMQIKENKQYCLAGKFDNETFNIKLKKQLELRKKIKNIDNKIDILFDEIYKVCCKINSEIIPSLELQPEKAIFVSQLRSCIDYSKIRSYEDKLDELIDLGHSNIYTLMDCMLQENDIVNRRKGIVRNSVSSSVTSFDKSCQSVQS